MSPFLLMLSGIYSFDCLSWSFTKILIVAQNSNATSDPESSHIKTLLPLPEPLDLQYDGSNSRVLTVVMTSARFNCHRGGLLSPRIISAQVWSAPSSAEWKPPDETHSLRPLIRCLSLPTVGQYRDVHLKTAVVIPCSDNIGVVMREPYLNYMSAILQ